MKNFWSKLPRPILALAPLAGYSDSAFRLLCKKYGAAVVYSEMASAAALVHDSKVTLKLLRFRKSEQPYVVQLFGSNPKQMGLAAKIVCEKIKPQGIDINFGCPVKKVLKQNCGAALMADLKLSKEVIIAVLANSLVPVSIKIRARSGKVSALDFLKNISDLPLAALMIHGRTLAQGFSGPIDLKIIKQARKYFSGVILANGGIGSREETDLVIGATGADGVGIGRAALGRPWIFQELKEGQEKISGHKKKIFSLALKHAAMAHKEKGKQGIVALRSQLCFYVRDLPGAATLREQLVRVESIDDIKKIFKSHSL